MGFLTRLIAGFVAASTLGAGLAGTANAVDAAGAASDTTGAVTTTADDTGGRTVLDCRQSGEGATGPYADNFCWIDWSNLPLSRTGEPIPVRINVPGGHIDADATITHTNNAALAAKDFIGSKWSRLTSAYKLTGNTALAFSGRMGRQDPAASVTFSNITPSADRTDTGVNVLKDFRLAFGDAEVMSGGVLQGHDVYEQTDIESDKTLEKLGMIGSGDPNQSYSKANTGYGTTHVTLAGGPKGATDDANKDSKGSAVVGAKQASRFKVSFGQVNQHWDGWGSAIAVGVYMPYLTAYPLTYDKNSSDAAGEVPSNQRGKENTTQPAKTKTNGTVKTVADENVRYGSLINGDFSYPSFSDIQKNEQENVADLRTFLKSDDGTLWYNMSNTDLSKYGKIGQIPGFDSSRFAWSSTENGSRVELQQDRNTKNTYAEIVAQQDNTSIYQNVSTGNGGVLYKIRLKHASRQSSHADRMQVLVGSDTDHATPVEMTRVISNGHGDKVGGKSTIITTKVSNTDPRDHGNQWETYEGYYQVPEGQKNTVFMFKSLEGFKEYETLSGNNIGNLVDDIEFSRSYKLTYDKNSDYATGSVPSDTTANTVKQAKAKTSGTVKTVADTSDGLPTELVNGDFEYPGADVLSQNLRDKKRNWWGVSRKDKMVYESDNPTKWVSLPSTFDSDRFAWDSSEAGKTSGVQEGSSQWHTNEVELQRDSRTGNMYAELSPYQAQSSIRQYIRTTPGALYKVRLKHASLSSEYLDKMQVLIGADGNEQPVRMTRVESQNGLDAIGESTASTTISTHASNKAEISWGSGLGYHSSRNHDGQWATYEGVYVATSDVTVFTFKSVDSPSFNTGNLLDDVVFTKAYKLTYDKNSADASGQVPSNQRGKENTTQPAKTKTSGTVKTVADTNASLPDHLVNGDFSVNYHDQWKDSFGGWTSIDPNAGKTLHATSLPSGSSWKWTAINGWDKSKFGWTSTQKAGSNVQQKANAVELQYDDSTADNVYAELCAYEAGTAIYQDIRTVPGTLYKVRLKHASLNSTYLDKMQVMIGTPGHEQPVEMTRTSVNGHGDKLNEKSTTIATKVTNGNNRHHVNQWETYEGTYLIPDGQTTTRFTFKSIDSKQLDYGNVLDGIVFDKAYRLDYDKNASDATGEVPSNQRGRENTTQPAKTKTNGTVKTVADVDSSKSLTVNPGFDVPDYSKLDDGGLHWMYVSPAEGKAWSYYDYINPARPGHQVAGLSQATFGWQELTGGDHKTTSFELHREKDGNVCADVHGSRTIGQTIDTQAGVAYTVSIRHSGRSKGNAGSVQVLVGPDKDHLRPLEMSRMNVSRTGAKYGDRIGSVGTVVTTHSDSVDSTEGDHPAWDHSDDWEMYSGTYVATGGKTVFAYRGVDKDSVIDDLNFKLAYRLTYDKNAQDAAGSVPSSQYGKENTVQPANAKTAGTVRTVADKTASGLTVHDLKNGEIAPVQYGDFKFSTTDGVTADQITDVNGFTVKTNWNPTVENQAYGGRSLDTMYQPNKNGANLILHHVGQWRDSSGTQRWLNAKITVNGQNLGSLVYYESQHKFLASYGKWDRHTSSRPYMDVTVDFLLDDGSTPQGLRGVTGFTDLDGGTSGYNEGVELVSGFDGAYVRSDAHLARFGTNGWAGATDENENNADAHGMKHYVGATFTGSSFRVRWSVASGQARGSGFQPVDSTIAYRLTYNKNAQDATGSIPSDTAANTIRPAKSETDGKVSDLVQRTTTHEDGSVTVKTIDTSTDVVSGCQVYYPAGQRITLATMAKDDDCWDSSMLSRPGHTQLGWNQDRNATQAQAQVTMVEGGMTVYAVWVGNPVLTYDTNKPSTWSGQMPSTPASVSVPYNTAAADGSGWQSGDTTKIKGYRFLGWYTTPQDGSNLYDWNTPLTGSVTVYAHWQRLQANVIYNANGGTGSHPNTTGWQYSDVTIPGDTSKSFKRDKYVFKGWGTKPGKADVVYKDGSKVALQDKDITLYAQWQEVHENFVETGGIGLPIAIAGGVLLLMFGIGSTVMLTRRMNGHGMPDDE